MLTEPCRSAFMQFGRMARSLTARIHLAEAAELPPDGYPALKIVSSLYQGGGIPYDQVVRLSVPNRLARTSAARAI